jgi:hypothetical protein
MTVKPPTRSNLDPHEAVAPTIRLRVRQPFVGSYDVILRPANDALDDVERFIIEHLTPRGTGVHRPAPSRLRPEQKKPSD